MFKLSCSDICGVTCVNNIIKQKRNILKIPHMNLRLYMKRSKNCSSVKNKLGAFGKIIFILKKVGSFWWGAFWREQDNSDQRQLGPLLRQLGPLLRQLGPPYEQLVLEKWSEFSLQSGQSWPKKLSDFTLNIGPNCP
jgi:hypothetical protein